MCGLGFFNVFLIIQGYLLPHIFSSLTFCVPSLSELGINLVFYWFEVVLGCLPLLLNVGECRNGMLPDLTDRIWGNLTDPLFTCRDTWTRQQLLHRLRFYQANCLSDNRNSRRYVLNFLLKFVLFDPLTWNKEGVTH